MQILFPPSESAGMNKTCIFLIAVFGLIRKIYLERAGTPSLTVWLIMFFSEI